MRICCHCGRCVEKLYISSADNEAYPVLSSIVLGAVLMSQASSLRDVTFVAEQADITGPDSAILVSCPLHCSEGLSVR